MMPEELSRLGDERLDSPDNVLCDNTLKMSRLKRRQVAEMARYKVEPCKSQRTTTIVIFGAKDGTITINVSPNSVLFDTLHQEDCGFMKTWCQAKVVGQIWVGLTSHTVGYVEV